MIQSYNHTIIQSYNHTIIQSYNHTIIQSYNHTIILNSKPGSVVVPTNYVSLGSFCRLERTVYNKVHEP
ncbi:hypothetical protein [Leptospira santarosai]|uniref:hypothetical protein n=1 Tax=Leptospira santarosai TaxID=28183 RepID=UPI0024AF199F|nr:hypothetical protein [Leptospira santarosai]MDI7211320.1 hypothetical protein [Leptospira santarosai]